MADQTVSFYPSETRAIPLTLIQVERRLPAKGEVIVHQGERVEPTDVVARVHQTQDFRIVDVARKLGVPKSQVKRFLLKSVGDTVEAGQTIAMRGGLPGRKVPAPAKGEIMAVGNGRVLIEVAPELIEVRAYLKGTISTVTPGVGVVIEATGAMVQGRWGCGGEAYGVLRVLAEKPDEPLRAKSIDVAAHGAIIVGGGWVDAAALEQAQQLQVRGLIIGSMEGELRALAESVGFPIILTEGFGRVPMAEPIFSLLHGQTWRDAPGNSHSSAGRVAPFASPAARCAALGGGAGASGAAALPGRGRRDRGDGRKDTACGERRAYVRRRGETGHRSRDRVCALCQFGTFEVE
jgi:hypothetical protein